MEHCSNQYLIEADGSVYPCDFYGLDPYKIGNVRNNSWRQLDQARKELGFVEQSQRVPEECCVCRWYALCRNGCRRDRLRVKDELGKNYYCESYAAFFDYAMPRLRRVRAMIQ